MKLMQIYEALLNEKTYDIDQDVDLLYVKGGFEGFMSDYNGGGKPFKSEILRGISVEFATFDSSILKTEESKKAHDVNPVKIECGLYMHPSNYYDPVKNKIRLSVRPNGLRYYYENDNIDELPQYQKKMIVHEITEERIKQSISHELSHWINDSLNKFYIKKDIDRAMDYQKIGKSNDDSMKSRLDGFKEVNLTPHEVQAQVHALKSLKKSLGDKRWDELTLEDVFNMTSLMGIHNRVSKKFGFEVSLEWQRRLMSRMHREGLLGKNMKNFVREV